MSRRSTVEWGLVIILLLLAYRVGLARLETDSTHVLYRIKEWRDISTHPPKPQCNAIDQCEPQTLPRTP